MRVLEPSFSTFLLGSNAQLVGMRRAERRLAARDGLSFLLLGSGFVVLKYEAMLVLRCWLFTNLQRKLLQLRY